jgi:MFS family permease
MTALSRLRALDPHLGPDFNLYWAGQTVSRAGSRVTNVALPLTAILVLHATPLQVGLVGASASAAALLFGLVAGMWVDRTRRRRTMILANAGRAIVLLTIPVAAWSGHLGLPLLCGTAFLSSSLGIFFDTAANAHLPALVPRGALVRANSALRVSTSTAGIVGPGLGGLLVQILNAPGAILVDILSYGVSVGTLVAIRSEDPVPDRTANVPVLREVTEGVRLVIHHPLLRTLTGISGTYTIFDSMLFGVYILYMNRTLHLGAANIGVVFGLAAVLGLVGAIGTSAVTRRIGIGRAIVLGIVITVCGELLIAGSRGPAIVATAVLVAAEGAVELGAALFGINAGSIELAVTPDALRGRVSAAADTIAHGMEPLGLLLGGALGGAIGLRQTLVVSVAGTALALLWLVRSPVPSLRELPVLRENPPA